MTSKKISFYIELSLRLIKINNKYNYNKSFFFMFKETCNFITINRNKNLD